MSSGQEVEEMSSLPKAGSFFDEKSNGKSGKTSGREIGIGIVGVLLIIAMPALQLFALSSRTASSLENGIAPSNKN